MKYTLESKQKDDKAGDEMGRECEYGETTYSRPNDRKRRKGREVEKRQTAIATSVR